MLVLLNGWWGAGYNKGFYAIIGNKIESNTFIVAIARWYFTFSVNYTGGVSFYNRYTRTCTLLYLHSRVQCYLHAHAYSVTYTHTHTHTHTHTPLPAVFVTAAMLPLAGSGACHATITTCSGATAVIAPGIHRVSSAAHWAHPCTGTMSLTTYTCIIRTFLLMIFIRIAMQVLFL